MKRGTFRKSVVELTFLKMKGRFDGFMIGQVLARIAKWVCKRRILCSFLFLMAINMVISLAVLFSNNDPVSMRLSNNLQPFNPPEIARDATISSWLPNSFGMASPGYNVGILYLYVVEAVFQNLWVSQWIIIFAPFWLGSLSMLLLLWKGGLTRSLPVLVVGPLVFSYNWLTLQYMGTWMMMYMYATIPLIILSMIRISRLEGSWTLNALLLSVTLSLGTIFYNVAGMSYMLPFFVVGVFFWIFSPNKTVKRILKSLATLLAGFGLYIALNLGFALPVLMGVLNLGVAGYATSAKFVVPVSNFLGYLQPHYFDSYFPNSLSPFLSLTSPDAHGFSAVGGLLILVVAVLPLIFSKKKNRTLSISLWIMFLLAVIMVLLIHLRSPLVQTIYNSIPLIWPINSADIYLLIFAGLLSVLFTLGLETLLDLRKKITALHTKVRHFRLIALVSCSVLIIMMVATAMFNHDALLIKPQSFSNGAVGKPYPSYINELSNFFDAQRTTVGPFRVLWVPQSHRVNMLMQSNDVYSDFAPSGLSPELHSKIDLLANTINTGKTHDLGLQLALLGYRYIVILNDFPGEGPITISSGGIDTYLTGAPANYERFLDNAGPEIKLINRTDSYSLYRNDYPSQFWRGMLWATNNSDLLSCYSQPAYNTLYVFGNDTQWSAWNSLSNTSAAPTAKLSIAVDNTELINGSSSLQLSLTSGTDGRLDSGIWRWFDPPLNLSSKFISLYAYGSGKQGQIEIILSSDEGANNSYNNMAQWAVPDDLEGWKQIQLPLSTPQQKYGLWNDSKVSGVLIKYFDESLSPQERIDIRLNEISITAINEVPHPQFSQLDIVDISPTYAPTKYIVNVNSPCELIFLQNFDMNWHAYLYDNTNPASELEHVKALDWANAFNVSGVGEKRVLLIYEPQADRDELLLAWSIVAPLATIGPILYAVRVEVPKIKLSTRKFIHFVRRHSAR